LWNGKDRPPKKNDEVINGGRVERRIIRSRTGHTIVFDDSDASSGITVTDKKGNTLQFDSVKNVFAIDVKGNTFKLDGSANTLAIDVAGNITIKAGGMVTIKGATINLN